MPDTTDPDRQDPQYLGDGVYAMHDGYQVKLTLGSHDEKITVHLEPQTLHQLIAYAKMIGVIPKE